MANTKVATPMTINTEGLASLRLMQLISPALPIGGFTYSQGIEWAVEAGDISDTKSLQDWLEGLIKDSLSMLDIPVLARLYDACATQNHDDLVYWSQVLLASRESHELRLEETNRARALTTLLISLDIPLATHWKSSLKLCQSSGFALAAQHWKIPLHDTALGFAWSWLENQVAAAIKLIPLGQTQGQQVLLHLSKILPAAIDTGLKLEAHDIGAGSPALAIASSLHETQYTRLFRS